MIRRVSLFLRRVRKREDGGPSIEFVLIFPPILLLIVSAFELGLLMTRHVMLERGMDMAVREVRLNTNVQFDEIMIKRMVCNAAGIIPNCMDRLYLEMNSVDLRETNGVSAATVPRNASCTDVVDPFELRPEFENGSANEMMVVRACARLVPMLPETGLGYFLSRMEGSENGFYRLVSTSAFVMEPI